MKPQAAAPAQNPLGIDPIPGLITRFAVPAIISMLVSAVYNITDQIFIGNIIGMYGNAATNVAFPLVMLTIAFSQLAGVGTATNFNICMGAKRTEEARHYIGTGLTLMSLFGLGIMLLALILCTNRIPDFRIKRCQKIHTFFNHDCLSFSHIHLCKLTKYVPL